MKHRVTKGDTSKRGGQFAAVPRSTHSDLGLEDEYQDDPYYEEKVTPDTERDLPENWDEITHSDPYRNEDIPLAQEPEPDPITGIVDGNTYR